MAYDQDMPLFLDLTKVLFEMDTFQFLIISYISWWKITNCHDLLINYSFVLYALKSFYSNFFLQNLKTWQVSLFVNCENSSVFEPFFI